MMQKKSIRILFVEDLSVDVEMAVHEIKRENIDFVYQVADNEEDFRKQLDTFKPDIVISDYSMPSFDGMKALKIAKSVNKHIPFIVFTGSMNEETAVNCMKSGADDYVIKEKIKRLPFSILEVLEKTRIWKEKEMMKNRLRESEEKYRSLIENSNDAIYLLYRGKFEIVNKKFEELFGYSFEELHAHGFDFLDLVAPESRDLIRERLRKIKKGEKIDLRYEFTALAKNNTRIIAETSVTYIKYKDGIATQGIIRDISKSKKLIDELKTAKEKAEESDRLKTAFLANVSHEIRTPMNGIMGFTELLKDHGLSHEKQKEYIEIIRKASHRMLDTINDLIDISKIETGQEKIYIADTNLTEVLENLFSFFRHQAEQKGLDFKLNNKLPSSLTHIMIDSKKLNSILNNLIKNAIKYTNQGKIELGCRLKGELLEFYVRDTGIGVDEEKKEAIFNRFVQSDISMTRSHEGAGLGLSVAKAYTELLGGAIWLESKPGKGSTFFFTLPLYRSDTGSPGYKIPAQHSKSEDLDNKLKILIVEDDEPSILYLETLLKEKNCQIIQAETGREAVEICRKHRDIDIILMDIRIPVLNGYEATRKIRKFNKKSVIIAQTAYAFEEDMEKAIEAGCDHYIAKPIKKNDLLKLISEVTSKQN